MNRALEAVREGMAQYLTEQGISTRTAWPRGDRKAVTGPVCLVSLRGCKGESAALCDYLGERLNEETGGWEEVYGRRVELTLGLDLYAPGQGEDLPSTMLAVAQALAAGGPQGVKVKSFAWGESRYSPEDRLCRREGEAQCVAVLYAVCRADGEFTHFELRGGLQK